MGFLETPWIAGDHEGTYGLMTMDEHTPLCWQIHSNYI